MEKASLVDVHAHLDEVEDLSLGGCSPERIGPHGCIETDDRQCVSVLRDLFQLTLLDIDPSTQLRVNPEPSFIPLPELLAEFTPRADPACRPKSRGG
jgi:hypothetical protein